MYYLEKLFSTKLRKNCFLFNSDKSTLKTSQRYTRHWMNDCVVRSFVSMYVFY